MRVGMAVLALLLAAAVPALVVAGGPILRGVGWLLLMGLAAVLLIDCADRLTEWIERRRWGRLARLRQGRDRSGDGDAT
jgi:hypothetical protein